MAMREELQRRYQDPMFSIEVPTMNLACIHGGDNPNRICGSCEMHFDLRPLPGMDPASLRDAVDRRLERLADETGLEIRRASLIDGIAPFAEAADAEIVRSAEQLTGAESSAVAFATEGPLLQQLGMQTVILGPGSIDQAHQPDEHMALDQVQPAIELYRRLIQRLCLEC